MLLVNRCTSQVIPNSQKLAPGSFFLSVVLVVVMVTMQTMVAKKV